MILLNSEVGKERDQIKLMSLIDVMQQTELKWCAGGGSIDACREHVSWNFREDDVCANLGIRGGGDNVFL